MKSLNQHRHIMLTGNTTFKLANFRRGLIERIISNGHTVTIMAPPDRYTDEVLKLGCNFIPLSMNRNGSNIIEESRLAKEFYVSIRRAKPDYVLSYTIKNNIYAGISCRILGIPFIPNITGLGPIFNDESWKSKLVKFLYKISFARARKVFFQNTSDRDNLVNGGIVPEKLTEVLPGSGVDLKKFKPYPLPSLGKDPTFLLVARMLKDKGVELFARSAAEVRAIYPNVKFLLLGPIDKDSLTAVSLNEIETWQKCGNIDYLGETSDVLPYLISSDCVVLPTWYKEGTPRSLLEASAVGRPLITTDIPGCRELVTDGFNGFLIPAKNQDKLTQACIDFIKLNSDQRSEMGRNSRTVVEREYDEEIVIQAYFREIHSSE